ncbi:MAG: hypothetical protein WA991_12305 [Ornithinimicrobium sp.]
MRFWVDHDSVADALGKYCDPYPQIDAEVLAYRGEQLILLRVYQFEEHPTLCKRDYDDVLQAKRLYTRTQSKPATGDAGHLELREILDLATAARLRQFVSTLEQAGLPLPSATDPYTQEADNNGVLTLFSKPPEVYWEFTIHPSDPYAPDRVPQPNLISHLEASAVRVRGWPLPMVLGDRLSYHRTSVAMHLEDPYHLEAWRFHKSGQHHQIRVPSGLTRLDNPTSTIQIWELVLFPIECLRLARNLAEQTPNTTGTTVTISLNGAGGHTLAQEGHFDLPHHYSTNDNAINPPPVTVQKPQLIASPDEHALELTKEFLSAFGAHFPDQTIAAYRDRLLVQTRSGTT